MAVCALLMCFGVHAAAADRPPPPEKSLLALGVDRRLSGSVRDGIGMDYRVGGLGGLQLNLYSRRDTPNPGRSWNLNAETPEATAFWLLGGSLDVARDRNDRQQVVFVPRLLLDFDALTERNHRLQAFVQYAPWHSSPGQATPDEGITQVAFRLRF
jgi:hypothetical protein